MDVGPPDVSLTVRVVWVKTPLLVYAPLVTNVAPIVPDIPECEHKYKRRCVIPLVTGCLSMLSTLNDVPSARRDGGVNDSNGL